MKLTVRFVSVLAVLSNAALGQMPRGSFLLQHVDSAEALLAQFDRDPVVRLHFRKALHLSDLEIRRLLSQLRVKPLTADHVYAIGFYHADGTWGFRNRLIRKGSRVFVTPMGTPFLVLLCGNPIQQPPGTGIPPVEAPPVSLPPLVHRPPELIPPIDLTPPETGLPPDSALPPLTALPPPVVTEIPPGMDIPPDLPPATGLLPPERGGWPKRGHPGPFPWWLPLLGLPFLIHGGGSHGGASILPPPTAPPPVTVPPIVPPGNAPVPEPGSIATWGMLLCGGAAWLRIRRRKGRR